MKREKLYVLSDDEYKIMFGDQVYMGKDCPLTKGWYKQPINLKEITKEERENNRPDNLDYII